MQRCWPGAERTAAGLLLICGLLATAGCRRSEPERSAQALRVPDGTPVVVISIDTLRADRLPIYGYDKVATPAIDALREDAILFERAYSHIGLTLPSHSSILSGLLPIHHGVRDNIGYPFPEDIPSLPVLFQEKGFATGAFVSSYVLRSSTGLSRGFDVYDDDILFETGKQMGQLQRPGAETLERATQWLQEVSNEPFFLFFHIYEPHTPYDPPAPYAARYSAASGPAAAYDGEVAAADAVIGALMAELERLGVYDEAIIVLLSDHGEGLMNHGEMDHMVLIYREVIQVPLLLKLPGQQGAGTTVAASAQLTDVAPTLLALLGMEKDPRLAGGSLLELVEGEMEERRIFSESVYPRIHFGWSELASMIEGDFHFIDGPDPELYNLRDDPGEKDNVIQSQRAVARRLRDEIRSYDRALQSPAEVDSETRARLEALGYVSGGVSPSQGPRADPKTRVHVLEELGRATRLTNSGDYEEAAAIFESVLEEEPWMPFAWQQLASVLKKAGDRQGALDAMVKALELSDGRSDLAASVAELYFELGDLEQAKAHAELALPSPKAYNVLATIALREGDLDAAERHLEQASDSKRILSLITKTGVWNKRQQYEEALAVCEEAERQFGKRSDRQALHGVFFQRGVAYGSLGRFAEAKEAYRLAIELAPRNLEAYTSLAFLYALESQGSEAGAVLEQMVTENPTPAAYVEAVKTLRAMKDQVMARTVLDYARGQWPKDEQLQRL